VTDRLIRTTTALAVVAVAAKERYARRDNSGLLRGAGWAPGRSAGRLLVSPRYFCRM